MLREPSFTVGIEEEYLLVDRESRDLIQEAPPTMLSRCEEILERQVTPEFMQCQIEVGTRVSNSIAEAAEDLRRLRRTVAQVAEEHGCAMIAASTHPFALAGSVRHTEKERYRILARDLQGVARRLLISGMHVHVGIDDDDLRIDLMGQAAYFLPHLLALSTSSPFWQGIKTGLMSYRIAVWDELPRTGLPAYFESYGEYERHLDLLIRAGMIEDATKIWWDLRPSARFPTLEMRISDICTRLEDALAVAALFRCWLRMLYRLRLRNQRWRRYATFLLSENRWIAQRYGFDKGMIDFGRGALVPYGDLLDEVIELVEADMIHFDCVDEVMHARRILERGTSAHWQIRTFDAAKAAGASDREAFREVVDMLIRETMEGI